jgi:DNA/RNA-binding domain of Phe-tRNA-synthetase-like protein
VTIFQYTPEILAKYPSVIGGMIHAQGMTNHPTPPDVLDLYQAEQQAVLKRIGDMPLSQLPSLSAWRGVFRGFGVDPTQIRSASEALLRRLTKQGDIPSINMLVDIGNLVSIRYGVPVAVVDRREMTGGITVRFADGTEPFTNLGTTEIVNPDVGEVIFSDDSNLVYARRWCWRQSDQSAAREDTTNAIITIEGHHEGARHDIKNALTDLLVLLNQFAGGTYTHTILDKDNPAFE